MNAISDWVLWLIDAGGYWGIFALMILENIVPPIPSELIMGLGGIRVAQGQMSVLPLLVAGTAGTTIGNYAWYVLGRRLGFERLRPLVDRFDRWLTVEWRDVERLNSLFRRHGQIIVFVLRFLPAFRTMISLPAGLFRLGHVRFICWTAAGATIWNVILVGAGWGLGQTIKQIDDYLALAINLFIVVAVIGYIWRLIRWRPTDAGSTRQD